ncbi:MAG: hypothetical protein II998_05955 [Clostridia bacterium]|nr:hypothetical protein [Clostridia bacterium]
MKLERFKSILLVLLVISSIVLTVNKWFNEKLWPEGYNFFSDVSSRFSFDTSSPVKFNPNEEVLKPAKIIINNTGNHVLYTKSSAEYQSLYADIKNILIKAFNTDDYTETSIQEWNNNLKSKSCYFSYPVTYDYGFLLSQITNKYQTSSGYCREFLISYDTRVSSALNLYIKDDRSEEIVKKRISYDTTSISSLIEASSLSDEQNYYSFELNFDMNSDDPVEQPVTIDSDVLISITEKNLPLIVEKNVFDDIIDNSSVYSQILSLFGINTSTIRRYVENDNSMVFVENYATIKLKTNGLLDYKAVDTSMGIELSGSNSYESINSCITFVNSVNDALFSGSEMYYEISSDIADIKSRTYTLKFDYYIKDNMISTQRDVFDMDHSIIIEVVSGKIVSYKQVCKEYKSTTEVISCPSAIDAIDSLSTSFYQFGEQVKDVFMAYTYNSIQNSWVPCWFIETSEGVISMVPLMGGVAE